MSLTHSAARSRVHSLYGTTIVGRLHGADRLLIAKLHSDPHAHVRFQPEDESLPRFRIPISEFPDANWSHKKMKGKWSREVTVEPQDWPPEKKLPSAKFNPPLTAQFELAKTDSTSKVTSASKEQLSNAVGSKLKKKTRKTLEDQASVQSLYQRDQIPQHLGSALEPSHGVDAADAAESSRGFKRIPRPVKNQSSIEPSRSSNRRLVEDGFVSPSKGRSKQPNFSTMLSNFSRPDESSIIISSSEDDYRRMRPGARSQIPRGNYVCYKCKVPGHFIEDCPISTPKNRYRTNERNDANEAVSESSVRYRRRRFDDEEIGSSSETPVRSLDFRRRQPYIESDVTYERQKASKKATPKKTFYKEYLNDEEVEAGIVDNSLVEGVLHVSNKRPAEAYVRRTASDSGRDIKIIGHHNRNRAYDGDTVVVRIFANEESADEAVQSSEEDIEPEPIANEVSSSMPVTLESLAAKLDAVILSEDAEQDDENQPRQLGEIVAVKVRAKDAAVDIIGFLKLLVSKNKEKMENTDQDDETLRSNSCVVPIAPIRPEPSSVILFQPISKKIPRGYLQNSLWPADLRSSDSELVGMAWNSIYSASYSNWQVHQKSPRVAKLELIGSAGHVESETKALLRATKISHSESFSPEVLDCLKDFDFTLNADSNKKWVIPQEAISERRDYRKARVFTIDPSTAKDLDDALSIRKVSDDIFEIGVHIADVSYFLKEDSPLDLEARKRCTSVYLVQKVIPMLPPLLCEELCSLNPGVDRLTFSVVWRMNRQGQICSDIAPWFGRTIIRSCAKLDYKTAQRIVDGEPNADVEVHGKHNFEDIAGDCKQMMEIAMARRAHRFDNGSLKLDRPKMNFQFDDDFNPTSVAAYELHDTNRMIEEYMLLANLLVAEKLAKEIPDVALLRRHVPPVSGKLSEILEVCAKLGYKIDGQSSKSLHKTLMQIEEEDVRGFISVLLTVAMKRAEYLCINGISDNADEVAEEKGFAHYALGFDAYTHFTSPIRRYADVIVHRMLEHCLARTSDPSKIKKLPDPEDVAKMASRCNEMKNRAKDAQDMSLLMYLAVLVKKQALIETAYVMDLGVKAFCVYVPRLGLEDRIMIEKIPDIKAADIKKVAGSDLKRLTLEWENGNKESFGMFEPLRVRVGVSSHVPYTVQLTVLPKVSTQE